MICTEGVATQLRTVVCTYGSSGFANACTGAAANMDCHQKEARRQEAGVLPSSAESRPSARVMHIMYDMAPASAARY